MEVQNGYSFNNCIYSSMSYLILRFMKIITIGVMLWILSYSLAEANDLHAFAGEANSHCESQGSALQASDPSKYTYNCTQNNTSGNQHWYLTVYRYGAIRLAETYGYISYHDYTSEDPDCSNEGSIGTVQESTASEDFAGIQQVVCENSCEFIVDGPIGDCQAEDTNGDGIWAGDDAFYCNYNYNPNGNSCVVGPGGTDGGPTPPNSSPDPAGGSYDCTTNQCGNVPDPAGSGSNSNPVDQSGIGDVDDPQDLPENDNTGGNHGAGDGDASTPVVGNGGGAGAADGDCDPFSNPDCSFSGTAGTSTNCENPPPCTGEPVLCSILQQNWVTACHDNGEVDLPSDCTEGFECTGDTVNCGAALLVRQQYCYLYGDEDVLPSELDPRNDTGDGKSAFDYDPKTDAELIQMDNTFIDQQGFAGGGSCPADQIINVLNTSVSIPFTPMCDLASILRPFVLISALFAAYMIIGGRKA